MSIVEDSRQAFYERNGILPPLKIELMRAGRNSEVLHLITNTGQWVLKNYYHHFSDSRDRLGTEFGFLTFLKSIGVSCVPQPLAIDELMHCGLYSFLPGRRPNIITTGHISQCVRFIQYINNSEAASSSKALPPAADACFSWQDHVELVEKRLRRLMGISPSSELEFAVSEFVDAKLLPLWSLIKNELSQEIDAKRFDQNLGEDMRILSPSDFGFHNTIEDKMQLSFVDFEYAGWDDPAKLACDFICQPELPISKPQEEQFIEELLVTLSYPEAVQHRIKHLLPVHRIKWCCILLNEFRVEDRNRRIHAGVHSDGLLDGQFSKVQHYFNTHLAFLI